MQVKGFILEDQRGREFVLNCEHPYNELGEKFCLRGWQRRRIVPLRYPEPEIRQIVEGALLALNEFFEALPRLLESRLEDVASSRVSSADGRGSAQPVSRRQ